MTGRVSPVASKRIGIAKTIEGDYATAGKYFRECLEFSQRHGFIVRLIEMAERVAYIAMLKGRDEAALSLFARACSEARSNSSADGKPGSDRYGRTDLPSEEIGAYNRGQRFGGEDGRRNAHSHR